jgi:hypothetical protein
MPSLAYSFLIARSLSLICLDSGHPLPKRVVSITRILFSSYIRLKLSKNQYLPRGIALPLQVIKSKGQVFPVVYCSASNMKFDHFAIVPLDGYLQWRDDSSINIRDVLLDCLLDQGPSLHTCRCRYLRTVPGYA